jgi:Domain of unknown function (DUF4157)
MSTVAEPLVSSTRDEKHFEGARLVETKPELEHAVDTDHGVEDAPAGIPPPADPIDDLPMHQVIRLLRSPVPAHAVNSSTRSSAARRVQRTIGNRASQQIVMRAPVVQRQCACGGTCAKCQEEEQPRPVHDTAQGALQRSSAAPAQAEFDGIPASTGEQLDPSTRRPMEAHFGADLADVRVHTGSEAAKSATSLDALAYTSGRDIYFASGMYAPTSDPGRRLLAHEVAHVVQQSSGKEPSIAAKSSHGAKIGAPDDILESEADRAAEAFMTGPLTDEEQRKKRESGGPVQRFIQRQAAPAPAGDGVDTSKAAAIKAELDSYFPSNSKLEALWASLGTSLPEAINDKAYRDLWWRSVNNEKISLTAAAGPLLGAFATDVRTVSKARLSSQVTRLENLQQELKRASEQNASTPPPKQSSVGGVEDPKRAMSVGTAPKPIADARGLVDTATVLHFLRDWDAILRSAPVGMRRVDTSNLLPQPGPPTDTGTFNPFPNSPYGQSGAHSGGAPGNQSPAAGEVPILFDPNVELDKLLELPNVEFIDREAFRVVLKAYQRCTEQRTTFNELYQALLAEDANLAVLAERGLLGQVSALSRFTDSEASATITRVAKENAEAARNFLDMLSTPGKVDWKALRPVQAFLLAGGDGGSRNWSNITAKGFVDEYFKEVAEAERARAQAELIAQLAIGAVTFLALLTPAAPLATAFLLATDAIAVGSALAASSAAEKKADVLSAGAAAQVVSKDDAQRAREDAESKQASLVITIIATALPYLPVIARGGAATASAIGREVTWEKLAERSTLLGAGPQVGDFVLDLTKVGISEFAKSVVGGELSLNYMVGRIRAISRTLEWIPVTAALEREGAETLLHPGSDYGLSGYIRYHIHGPGTGAERFPIFLSPTKANQFANNSIEGFMRRQRDAGASVNFRVTYATYNGTELRPFVESLLKTADKEIIERLARDQGLIEKFLKEINYEITVTPAGGPVSRYQAGIAIGAPPSGAVTSRSPTLVP